MKATVEYVNGVPRVVVDPEGHTGTIYVVTEAGERREINGHGAIPFVDDLAPLSGSVKYGKTAGINPVPPWSVTVVSGVADAIVSRGGHRAVKMIRANQRSRSFDTGAVVTQAVNNPRPWVLYPKVTRDTGFTLAFHTLSADTLQMEELVRSGGAVEIRHNANHCRVPGCLIEPSQWVYPVSAKHDYVGYTADGEVVAWVLECIPAERPHGVFPARTWFLDGDAVNGSWALTEGSWFGLMN